MTYPATIIHWVEHLRPGGVLAVIEDLMQLCSQGGERIIATSRADQAYANDLQRRGLLTQLITNPADLIELARSRPVAIVIHSGGERTPERDRLLDALGEIPRCCVLELNVFGFLDDSRSARRIDLHLFNSKHTMWRHWVARGQPPAQEYLARHRTLYNPVVLAASPDEIDALQIRGRARLGIPRDAFVVGDICRPDPRKLDYMLAAIASRMEEQISSFHVVTQRFPDNIAADLRDVLGAKYHNLPFAMNRGELLESYAIMDVFAHFSTMGESFGMAVAEAMRCGLPVVANETPGRTQNNAQPELIIHGETGFFANDPYTAAQRLVDLAQSPKLRRRFGEAGRARFTAPPLDPASIARQLTSEVGRLAAAKGISADGLPPPAPRTPSLEEEEVYLRGYRPKYTVRPLRPPFREAPETLREQAARLWWRARRRSIGLDAGSSTTPTAPRMEASRPSALTVIHWVQTLTPGGGLSVIEGFTSQRGNEEVILSASQVDPAYVKDLQRRGMPVQLITEQAELLRLIKSRPAVAIVMHSGGERMPERDRLLDALFDAPHCCVLERNIFGFVDHGAPRRRIDLHMFNSKHTMWRHWEARGRPPLQKYLTRHRTLYNPVTLTASTDEIAALRVRGRGRLGIPADAFVIGDVCRPDPRKLDYMLAAIAPRIDKEIGPIHVLTQRFPDNIAADLQQALGDRYHNLPFAIARDELLESYAVMDVFAHFSTMGESFGMAVAEAMRCGLPIIANETPDSVQNNAQMELIVHGETGFFANEPYTAVRRLVELAQSSELRRRLGDAGRARFSVPPLDPTSIAHQLISEITRVALTKGISIPGLPPPAPRIPSLAEDAAYLTSYQPSYKTRWSRPPISDLPWFLGGGASRLWWRARRRYTSGSGTAMKPNVPTVEDAENS